MRQPNYSIICTLCGTGPIEEFEIIEHVTYDNSGGLVIESKVDMPVCPECKRKGVPCPKNVYGIHGMVLTLEDAIEQGEERLPFWPDEITIPQGQESQWGICENCHRPMRWSNFRWRDVAVPDDFDNSPPLVPR